MKAYKIAGNFIILNDNEIIVEKRYIKGEEIYIDDNEEFEKYYCEKQKEYSIPYVDLGWGARFGKDLYTPPKNTSITALLGLDGKPMDPVGVVVRIPSWNVLLEKIRKNIEKHGDPGYGFKRSVKILYSGKYLVLDIGDYLFKMYRDKITAFAKDFGLDGLYRTTAEDVLDYAMGKPFKGKLLENVIIDLLPYALEIMYSPAETKIATEEDYRLKLPEVEIFSNGEEMSFYYNELRIEGDGENLWISNTGQEYAIKLGSLPEPSVNSIVSYMEQSIRSIKSRNEIQTFEEWENHFGVFHKAVHNKGALINIPLVGRNVGYRIVRSDSKISIIFYEGEQEKEILKLPPDARIGIIKKKPKNNLRLLQLAALSRDTIYNDILQLEVKIEFENKKFIGTITPFGADELKALIETSEEFHVI